MDLGDIAGFWTAPLTERAEAFAALRRRPGLAFFAEPNLPGYLDKPGPGFYALTRRDDIVEASTRADVFRSWPAVATVYDPPPELRGMFTSMINLDNPRHARLRRIVSRGFTPRRLEQLHDRIRQTAATIVDEVIEQGSADAVTDIAARLPLTIICELMGIPPSQYRLVFDCTNVLIGIQDPDYVGGVADIVGTVRSAAEQLAALMHELGDLRARTPTHDVTSALVSAEIDGERLTRAELASFFTLLVIAGNETTRNVISWGIHALSAHPAQQAAWAGDLDGMTGTAVEELIRWSSPVIFMRRTVATQTELAGTALAPGDRIALFYWSGNRDEDHFAEPEALDLRRSPNPHIGFGGPGPHFCLGAHLARTEIAAMFTELLRRVPDLHSTAEPARLTSMFINGVKSLPVAFTPGPRRAS